MDRTAQARYKIQAGNTIRQLTGRNNILALVAAGLIADRRLEQKGEEVQEEGEWQTLPLHRTVHIIASLKRPEEVNTLRRIYGSGFFLVGVSASKEEREKYLAERGIRPEDAAALIETDA